MRWAEAVKLWNSHKKSVNAAHVYCMPRKDTPEHAEVKKLMEAHKLKAAAAAKPAEAKSGEMIREEPGKLRGTAKQVIGGLKLQRKVALRKIRDLLKEKIEAKRTAKKEAAREEELKRFRAEEEEKKKKREEFAKQQKAKYEAAEAKMLEEKARIAKLPPYPFEAEIKKLPDFVEKLNEGYALVTSGLPLSVKRAIHKMVPDSLVAGDVTLSPKLIATVRPFDKNIYISLKDRQGRDKL